MKSPNASRMDFVGFGYQIKNVETDVRIKFLDFGKS